MQSQQQRFIYRVIEDAIFKANETGGFIPLDDDCEKRFDVTRLIEQFVGNHLSWDQFRDQINNLDVVDPSFWGKS